MSNGHNAGQPVQGQQGKGQAAPAAANQPPPAYNPMRAEHEAAHAVVIDDLGYQVTKVNIKTGIHNGQQLFQMTQANWGAFGRALATINWDDPAQVDAIRPGVLNFVTNLVAAHLAENLIDGATQRISTRIQEKPLLLDAPPDPIEFPADRDRTAFYLNRVQCNTMAEVVAAEQRALEILTRRQAHLRALAALLLEHGTVEGEMLDNALGH